jgi:MFS family permease
MLIQREDGMNKVQGSRWYYGWNIVAVCMLSQIAANGILFNSLPLFLKPWSEELHAPISEILLCYLPMLVIMSALSPVIGAMADRKPARLLIGLGVAALVPIHLAMSAVTKIWQVQALYALAVPAPMTLAATVVCNPLISRWFVKRAGLALGLSAFGIAIGGIVLPPLIAAAIPVIGWRNVWLFAGIAIGAIILPAVLLVVRERPTKREGFHYLTEGGAAPLSLHGHGSGGGQLGWTDILKRKNFLLITAVFIGVMNIYIGSLQNLGAIVISHGFTQQTTGVLLSVFNASHVAATLLMGVAADKIGGRLSFAFLALAAAGGALLLGFGDGFGPLVCGAALVGFGGGIWPVLAASIGREFGASDMGRAFGMATMTLVIPGLMPTLIARVQEGTGSYAPAMSGLAIFSLAASILVLQLRERPSVTVADNQVAHA